jgi:hypothetical protein
MSNREGAFALGTEASIEAGLMCCIDRAGWSAMTPGYLYPTTHKRDVARD